MNKTLLDSLFHISNVNMVDDIVEADVEIAKDNEIFRAHFPCNPITPGVCQLYLVKKILQLKYVEHKVTFEKSRELKFTNILTPNKVSNFKAHLKIVQNNENILVDAKLFDKENVFLKAKVSYKIGGKA